MGGGIGKMKVTILTPTFNDANFISLMIESVLKQNYQSWELLISDDASNDNTPEIVYPFLKDDRIRYFRSEVNEDQLNALYKIVPWVTGDIVMLLHSDDMLSDESVLSRIVSLLSHEEKELDGIYADLLLIDLVGNATGKRGSPNTLDERIILKAFLSLGANVINDVFCVKRAVFLNHVVNYYILWNIFYWIKFDGDHPSTLRLCKVNSYYKYRRHRENYMSSPSEARRAFVLNGCYRTIIELSYYYRLERALMFKVLSAIPKIRRLLRCFPQFFVAYNKRDSLEEVINSLKSNVGLLQKLICAYNLRTPTLAQIFYAPVELVKNLEYNKKVLDIELKEANAEESFFGKDARKFFEKILNREEIPCVYTSLVEESPFLKAVRVPCEDEVIPMRNILRFLCLPLPILVGDEKPCRDFLLEGLRRRFSWTH